MADAVHEFWEAARAAQDRLFLADPDTLDRAARLARESVVMRLVREAEEVLRG